MSRWLELSRRRRRAVGLVVALLLAVAAWGLADRWIARATADHRLRGIARTTDEPIVITFTTAAQTRRIRLAGIAVPPAWRATTHGALVELIDNRPVTVVLDEAVDGDPRAALVYRDADGLLVSEHLINQGLARWDGDATRPLGPWLGRLEGYARDDGRGMWQK